MHTSMGEQTRVEARCSCQLVSSLTIHIGFRDRVSQRTQCFMIQPDSVQKSPGLLKSLLPPCWPFMWVQKVELTSHSYEASAGSAQPAGLYMFFQSRKRANCLPIFLATPVNKAHLTKTTNYKRLSKSRYDQVWWFLPEIPTLEIQRQADPCEF